MAKNGFISFLDDLPFIVKIILCIPALDIIWAAYRIVKGVTTKNVFILVVGILWIIPGAAFLWLVDLISILLTGKLLLA